MAVLSARMECRLLDACIVAYDIKDGRINPDTPYYRNIGIKPGTTPVVFEQGPEKINAGYVAETEDDWVLLVYRGTLPPFEGDFWAWVDDWINDFKAGPTDWTVGGKPFGKVETGFASAVSGLWDAASQALLKAVKPGTKGVIVTGHSKGGGMSFPAAARVNHLLPHVPVVVSTFAAPLTCDRTFQGLYGRLGLKSVTVRYQNRYDLVPFLPYWPTYAMLAAAERRHGDGTNRVVTEENWPSLENDYVPIGYLRYLADGCRIETGDQGAQDAHRAIWHALEHLELETIAEAHSATGRYHKCVCDSLAGGES